MLEEASFLFLISFFLFFFFLYEASFGLDSEKTDSSGYAREYLARRKSRKGDGDEPDRPCAVGDG